MNIKPLWFALLGAGALLLVGCSNPPAQQAAPAPEAAPAAAPAPITPKASINAMMVAFVDHASHNHRVDARFGRDRRRRCGRGRFRRGRSLLRRRSAASHQQKGAGA